MTFESGLSFFLAIFIFGITPGPGIFAIIARSIMHGSKSCFMLCLGMTISDMLYLIAACLGLAVIASTWSEFFTVVRIAGAMYLFYLAWKMWTAPVNVDPKNKPETHKAMLASFIQGFLISASNPKVILFYIAFLPTFMDLTALNTQDIVLASALTLVALMAGLMLVAQFASSARAFLKSERSAKRLNKGAGSIMAGAGLYLITRH